jgi:hypothetical protein
VTRILFVAVVSAVLFIGYSATAKDSTEHQFGPYINASASQSGATGDLGIEYLPSRGGLGGRLLLSAGTTDPSQTQPVASSEKGQIGAKADLLGHFLSKPKVKGEPFGHFGALVEPQVSVTRFTYNPGAGAAVKKFKGSWKGELRLWWFGSPWSGLAQQGAESDTVTGNPPPISSEDYFYTLIQPQLRVSYARSYKEADDVFVVKPASADGLQLVDKMKIDSPQTKPTITILLALPIEPKRGRSAFGPAFSYSKTGKANAWWPKEGSTRVRLEAWLYYFAFGEAAATRVGIAPFVDVRTAGDDKRDDFIVGAILELRTSTARLEY